MGFGFWYDVAAELAIGPLIEEGIRLRLLQAYEYERGNANVRRGTWRISEAPALPRSLKIENSQRVAALLGGFLRKWRDENKGQSDAFLKGVARNVSDAFDEIIKLENAKVKN